jgi:hypothetical protein
MKLVSFNIQPCSGTLYIFDRSNSIYAKKQLENVHYRQGFSWSPGNIAVFTIHGIGCWDTEIHLDEPVHLSSEAERAIQLTFTVTGNKGISIADDIGGGDYTNILNFPPGNYALTVEQGFHGAPFSDEEKDDSGMWCKLWFNTINECIKPQILIQDDLLHPVYPLQQDKLTDYRPANPKYPPALIRSLEQDADYMRGISQPIWTYQDQETGVTNVSLFDHENHADFQRRLQEWLLAYSE